MNDRSKSSSAEKDDVNNNNYDAAEREQLMMLRREEGKEEKALDAFENHRNINKDQEWHEFWGLSITDAMFWFAGTISRELALMLNFVQLCTRDDGYQDDDEVLANVIYDDYRVIVVVHQDLLHSKCILEH